MENIWLQEVIDIYKKYFGNTATHIMDIGTRDGDDAAFLQEKLEAQNIYAVDARLEACDLTKQKYPHFNVRHACISDNDQSLVDFHRVISEDKDYSGSSSIYNEKLMRPEYPHEKVSMRTMTMKKLLRLFHIENEVIDIIKVDIEGFTYQLLVGLGEKIKNVKLFHLETEKWHTHAEHKNNLQVSDYMLDQGFVLESVQYEWGPDIEDQIWINPRWITRT